MDIHPKSLYAWVTAYKKEHNLPTRNINLRNTQVESEAEELKRLRRENKILKQERDILKKATAYFAKEYIKIVATTNPYNKDDDLYFNKRYISLKLRNNFSY